MGYFDGLTEVNFKKIDNNKTIFYSRGIFFKGYIMSDSKAEEVKNFLNAYYRISLPITILTVILCGEFLGNPFFAMASTPLFIIYYKLKMNKIVVEKVYTKYKMSIKERFKTMSFSMGRGMSILLFFLSLLMTFASLYVFLFIEKDWFSFFRLLLFGASLVQSVFMIYYSRFV